MINNKFLLLGLAAVLSACSFEDNHLDYEVKDFISINDCGHKFSQITYLSMSNKTLTQVAFHGSEVKDSHGNVLQIPSIRDTVDPKDCTINHFLKKKM